MTRKARSFATEPFDNPEPIKHGGAVQPPMSSVLSRNTTTIFARLADLQADAARTALADAVVAARELCMTTTPDRLLLVWIAQLQHGVARMLNLDGQLARAGCALQDACSDAWHRHAADWLRHAMALPPAGAAGWHAWHRIGPA